MKAVTSLRAWAGVAGAVTALVACPPATASLELADKSACLNCHQVERKMAGPSFRDIAARYQDRKDNVAYLAERVMRGSAGSWGSIPMPPNPAVSAEDAQALAGWINGLAGHR